MAFIAPKPEGLVPEGYMDRGEQTRGGSKFVVIGVGTRLRASCYIARCALIR